MTAIGKSLAAGLLLAGAALATEPAATAGAHSGERIGVEVTLSRASGGEARYVCATTVKDLSAKQILAAPKIQFRLDETATVTTDDPVHGLSVEISVAVTGAGEQVDHVVLVRRGGELVASQSVTLHLPL